MNDSAVKDDVAELELDVSAADGTAADSAPVDSAPVDSADSAADALEGQDSGVVVEDTAPKGADGEADSTADSGAALPCPTSPDPLLWRKPLADVRGGPVRVAGMSDGGFAVASSDISGASKLPQARVRRLSSTGGTAWITAFPTALQSRVHALVALPGGALLLAGERQLKGDAQPRGWLAKLDAKGQVLWQRTVVYEQQFNGKLVASEGALRDLVLINGAPVGVASHLAPSSTASNPKIESTVTWFSADGKVAKQHQLYLGGSTAATVIAPWETDGVVVAGTGYGKSAGGDAFVVTFAKPGSTGGIHSIIEVFASPGADRVTGIARLGGGRLVLSGWQTLAGTTRAKLWLVDGSGKTLVLKTKSWLPKLTPPPAAGVVAHSAAHGLWLASDGSLVMAAEVAVGQPPSDGSGAAGGQGGSKSGDPSGGWLVGLSGSGEVLWQRDVGVAGAPDTWLDLAGIPGDKLVAAGLVAGKSGDQLRVLRASPWGHTSCAEAGLCGGQSLASCVDANPCTATACAPATGCTAPALADGSSCPGGSCSAGVCPP